MFWQRSRSQHEPVQEYYEQCPFLHFDRRKYKLDQSSKTYKSKVEP